MSENEFYDEKQVEQEIHDLLTAIIEADSVDVDYPTYKISSVLPKYTSRDQKQKYVSKPPPYSEELFPDIAKEFNNVFGYKSSANDIEFFDKQERDSREIQLSEIGFKDRLAVIDYTVDVPYLYFSIPLFNASRNVAWVQTGIVCGPTCGEGRTLIMQKKDGIWRIISVKSNWIS